MIHFVRLDMTSLEEFSIIGMYVLSHQTWTLESKLSPSGSCNDLFLVNFLKYDIKGYGRYKHAIQHIVNCYHLWRFRVLFFANPSSRDTATKHIVCQNIA